jgi:hypothetical protein
MRGTAGSSCGPPDGELRDGHFTADQPLRRLQHRCRLVSRPSRSVETPPDEAPVDRAYYYTASKAVYREVPNLSTMYHARPHDTAAIRREAAAFRANEYFKDLAPPVLYRVYEKIRWRLLSKQKQN